LQVKYTLENAMRGYLVVLVFLLAGNAATSAPFTVTMPDPAFVLPTIVIQYDPATKTGADWAKLEEGRASGPEATILEAAAYLREGVRKMTGRTLPVISGADLAKGIVLTTPAGSPGLRNDAAVREALKNTGEDSYNDREAFFIRTEKDRVLLVANTPAGLAAAVVELLESVEYEVLGLGPNWTHVPDYTTKPLVFDLTRAGRPGYYIRGLWCNHFATLSEVNDPADEPVGVSYRRWQLGTRMYGKSMPGFPGHAMQGYHNAVVERMFETQTTEGFLVKKCTIGPEPELIDPLLEIDPLAGDGVPGGLENLFDEGPPPPDPNARPEASEENKGELWISTERDPAGRVKAFFSDGKRWERQDNLEFDAKLDHSVRLVREIIFAEMKRQAERHFADHPDDVFIFGTEPEDGDGGYSQMGTLMRYPNWYADYRKAEGIPLGAPYALHGQFGLDQPTEVWDPELQSNTIYGFDDWLLREFDKWIDALPPAQRVTASGKDKKSLARCSHYSYGWHDVPSTFNPDPRIRVMIAGFPKHRGRGKWAGVANNLDTAKALKVILPREPSGDYRYFSHAYYRDVSPGGIPAGWSAAPASLSENYRNTYQAGIKALNAETDLNFGKYGLAYYLVAKMLWNPHLTAEELDAIRDRWFHRAYGSGWREMKAYYDFMLTDNYPGNTPQSWARAVRLIDAAQQKLDKDKEPAAQRRLDDLKQYWYYHYLVQSEHNTPHDERLREYVWKGQMSYMVSMHLVVKRHIGGRDNTSVQEAVSGAHSGQPEIEEISLAVLDRKDVTQGPAHFTHEETQKWWAEVLAFWPEGKAQ
jgi:hypothetical protein